MSTSATSGCRRRIAVSPCGPAAASCTSWPSSSSAQRDLDRAFRRGELERIAHEVDDDLLEPCLVDVGPHRIEIEADRVSLRAAGLGERGHGVPDRLRELDRAPLEDDLAERHPGDV